MLSFVIRVDRAGELRQARIRDSIRNRYMAGRVAGIDVSHDVFVSPGYSLNGILRS